MNKRELDLLEKAFEASINAAFGGVGLIQPRGTKLADKLVTDGYLERAEVKLGGRFPVTIRGYGLTLLGNLVYCTSCDVEPSGAN